MSDSTTQLDTISSSQAQKEVSANALFDAMSPAAIFGRRASTSAALTFGYYGGDLWVDGVLTTVANGTVALSASTTNYVEATRAGVVSKNTTGFTAGQIPLYTVVTGTSTVTSYTDHRLTNTPFFGRLVKSVAGGAGDTTLTAAEARADSFEFTGTLTGNRNVILPTVPWQKQFFNNTSGAFTLTVKTSAGTGIAVTQTKRATLECDGTNVVTCDTDIGNAATATKWATARDLSLTGDGTATFSNVDGSAAVSSALTLATVNSNVGTFGSASKTVTATVNAKGLVTAFSEANVVFPSSVFASLPAASTVSGQTWLVTDVGPAPGILLTSNGTIWRPAGGRQVLAMRVLNPVTVQSLTSAVAETLGAFPGGLVKAGMELELEVLFSHSGIGTASRAYRAQIGNSTPIGDQIYTSFISASITNSGSDLSGVHKGRVFARSDTNTPAHPASPYGTSQSYGIAVPMRSMTVNFSLPWYIDIQTQSCAETAVNITAASWAAGVATYTATAHTLAVGDKTTIAGITPSGYNGVLVVTSVPNANTFTAAVVADPGAYTSGGTTSRISNMISQSYVLSLIG